MSNQDNEKEWAILQIFSCTFTNNQSMKNTILK